MPPLIAYGRVLRRGDETPVKGLRRGRTRKLDPDVGAAIRAVSRLCLSAVRRRDALDDRETEPGAAPAAGRVRTGEALERGVDEVAGEAGAPVRDVDLHRAVCRRG